MSGDLLSILAPPPAEAERPIGLIDGPPFTANGFYMRFSEWRERAALPAYADLAGDALADQIMASMRAEIARLETA